MPLHIVGYVVLIFVVIVARPCVLVLTRAVSVSARFALVRVGPASARITFFWLTCQACARSFTGTIAITASSPTLAAETWK